MTTQKLMEQADALLGQMDSDLGKATERMGVVIAKLAGQPELREMARQAQAHISAAHGKLGQAGVAVGDAAKSARGEATDKSGGGADDGLTFPLERYNHRFQTREELEDYERRVSERDRNLDGSDADAQATLQPGQADITKLNRAQLERVMRDLGSNDQRSAVVFRRYGPTKLVHELSKFMDPAGIQDTGGGLANVPASFSQVLAGMTVDEAKALAGR